MAASIPRWKGMVYAGAFGAVTIVGTIYGAGLKTQRELKIEKERIIESTAEEKIAMLESRRRTLVTQKTELEKKLATLHARMGEKQDGGGGGGGNGR